MCVAPAALFRRINGVRGSCGSVLQQGIGIRPPNAHNVPRLPLTDTPWVAAHRTGNKDLTCGPFITDCPAPYCLTACPPPLTDCLGQVQVTAGAGRIGGLSASHSALTAPPPHTTTLPRPSPTASARSRLPYASMCTRRSEPPASARAHARTSSGPTWCGMRR